MIQDAVALEGQIFNNGVHASGVVVSDRPLWHDIPIGIKRDMETRISGFEMKDTDTMGLLKLDILGLRTLRVISNTIELVNRRHDFDTCDCIGCQEIRAIADKKKERLNLLISKPYDKDQIDLWKVELESVIPRLDMWFEDINYSDQKVFKLFQDGNTLGIFQFESKGFQKLSRRAKPVSITDLSDLNALHRPGPIRSGIMHEWLLRRNGKSEIPKVHPFYDKITKGTLGSLLFQEQIMAVVHDVGGFVWSKTDIMRKAISKSVGEEFMRRFKIDFVEGAIERGMTEEDSGKIFDQIISFGSYCLAGSTNLRRSTKGRHCPDPDITMKEMYDIWNSNTPTGQKYKYSGVKILSLDEEDLRVKPNKVLSITYSGVKPVYEVTTETGKKLRGTKEHVLMSVSGYETIEKLNVGDSLLCCDFIYDKTPAKSKEKEPKRECKGKNYKGCGFPTGEDNPGYTDGRCQRRLEAVAPFEDCDICLDCGKEHDRLEFHHLNGDHDDHRFENITLLCPSCHRIRQYAMGRIVRGQKGYQSKPETIISIEFVGEEDTYDIMMEDPNNNFLANGIVSHNSFNAGHSAAYGILAFKSAFLKTYFSKEFILCEINSLSSDDENIHNLIQESRRLGVQVNMPDINKSDKSYSLGSKSMRAGFLAIKGVGEKASINIVENQPYKNWFEFFGKINRRQVHLGVIRALIRAGAFKSMYPNTKVLLENVEVLISGSQEMKETLLDVASEMDLETYPPYTIREETELQMTVLSLPTEINPLDFYQDVYESIDETVRLVSILELDSEVESGSVLVRAVMNSVRYGYRQAGKKEGEDENVDEEYKGGAYVNLDDGTDFIMGVFNPTVYERYKLFLENAEGSLIIAKVRKGRNSDKVDIDDVSVLSEFQENLRNNNLSRFEQSVIDPPLKKYIHIKEELKLEDISDIVERLPNVGKKAQLRFCGVVSNVREHTIKNGGVMAFMSVDDGSSSIEILVWPEAYSHFRRAAKVGEPVAIKARRLDQRPGEIDFKLQINYEAGDKIYTLAMIDNQIQRAKSSDENSQ